MKRVAFFRKRLSSKDVSLQSWRTAQVLYVVDSSGEKKRIFLKGVIRL